MNRWLKRSLLAVGTLLTIGSVALPIGTHLADQKMQRSVPLPDLVAVPWREDNAAVERGRYLYASRGCGDCHGLDGAGRDVINDGKGMLVHAPNITRGRGGVVADYTALDWTRTIRHGVKPGGQPVLVMPSEDYNRLTDDDLASLVAHIRQLPRATGSGARIEFPLPVKVAYAVGAMRDAAEKIDHRLPPARPVPEAVKPEHGAYVANACIGCHGAQLAGGKIGGAPPDWPAAANLTPGANSALAHYPDGAAMAAMFRTGKRPDGSAVSAVMPFQALGAMSDTDIQALFLHLKTLPARPLGG